MSRAECRRDESRAEGDLWGSAGGPPPVLSCALIWPVCEETAQGQGKNHPKGLEGPKPSTQAGLEHGLLPAARLANLRIHGTLS